MIPFSGSGISRIVICDITNNNLLSCPSGPEYILHEILLVKYQFFVHYRFHSPQGLVLLITLSFENFQWTTKMLVFQSVVLERFRFIPIPYLQNE